MSAVPGPPPEGGDINRGPAIEAIYWVLTILATAVVALRFYARYTIRGIGLDDWIMLLGLVLLIAVAAMTTYLASLGGFRHLYYLGVNPGQMLLAIKIFWATQPFGIMGLVPPKISVALTIMRIMGPTNKGWQRWFLWFAIVSLLIFNSLCTILQFVQCDPPAALWTPGLPANCWDPKVQANFATFVGSWNAFLDFTLALIPITIIVPLKMSTRKQVGLCFLLGLGLFAGISASVKTSHLAQLSARSDLTWETFDLFSWQASEMFLLIICGSIPPLKPLFSKNSAKSKGYYSHPLSSTQRSYPRNNTRTGHPDTLLPPSEHTNLKVYDPAESVVSGHSRGNSM